MTDEQISRLDEWLLHLKKGIVWVLHGHIITWTLLVAILVILIFRR